MKKNSILRQVVASSLEILYSMESLGTCTTPGCNNTVSKPGYTLCYNCWKAQNSQSKPKPKPQVKPQTIDSPSLINATKISEELGINKNHVNSILAELGLLTKEKNGWIPTRRGLGFGAVQQTHSQTGVPYVLWPESILENQVFLTTIESLKSDKIEEQKTDDQFDSNFRTKFQAGAKHRTTDGHWVRSKAEVMIDNWLYMTGLVHAYERRLPIEEEAYCDFYVPAGKVYIEYWGYENNSEYLERKKYKQELYKKYDLNLIELSDEQVRNLDDYLPQLLIQFGVTIT